jgi:hypothetical protein
MTATTIAEIFVDEGSVRVELEIGLADLEAFRDLMPDELYEGMGNEPEALSVRAERFFRQGLIIRAGGGEPIAGEVARIVPRRRIRRDEITGEPLPADDQEQELVVFAELVYPLEGRPATISLRPPTAGVGSFTAASIGFVVYHRGLPVNDFRYLAREETLDLDWEDPWYSQFRNRNLWRWYRAPLQGFLYVDHFEVRKEIIARPRDLQQWVDLGIEGRAVIRAEEQGALKAKVADFLAGLNPVTIDGKRCEPVLDRIHFIRRSLRTTGVVDPPEDLPAISATLGVIFVYPITALPQEVTMEWELFSDRIAEVPVVATDEAGGMPSTVSADEPVLTWRNFLKNPIAPTLVDLAPPPAPPRVSIPLLSVACAVLVAGVALRFVGNARRWSRRAVATAGLLTLGVVLLWPLARVTVAVPFAPAARVSDADARTVVSGLLRNIYRAFDYREEGTIYDTLARSTSGELLTQVYLETRRSLELRNQGGARAKVTDVEMLDAETANLEGDVGFETQCTWNVAGSVGHWGHIHQRRNQYEAVFTVRPVDGVWKITKLELLSEQRL